MMPFYSLTASLYVRRALGSPADTEAGRRTYEKKCKVVWHN